MTSRVPEGQPETPPQSRRLLCLSGGGYRGLFSAIVLEHIEAQLQRLGHNRLRDYFDLISGTSIGGLLACGIAAGVSAQRLREALEEDGGTVFPKRSFSKARQMMGSLYSADALKNVISKCLAADAKSTLQQVSAPLLVPAVSWITGEVVLYKSRGLAGNSAPDISLLDVCLATSAAPTYFPPHQLKKAGGQVSDVLVDGGLVANAPDLAALTAAIKRWPLPLDRFEVLSIGTAGSAAGGVAATVPSSGAAWASRAMIVTLVLSAQERHAVANCKTLLGDRYFRIDQQPSQGQLELQAMDRVDASTTATLRKLAEHAVEVAKQSAPAWAIQLV